MGARAAGQKEYSKLEVILPRPKLLGLAHAPTLSQDSCFPTQRGSRGHCVLYGGRALVKRGEAQRKAGSGAPSE